MRLGTSLVFAVAIAISGCKTGLQNNCGSCGQNGAGCSTTSESSACGNWDKGCATPATAKGCTTGGCATEGCATNGGCATAEGCAPGGCATEGCATNGGCATEGCANGCATTSAPKKTGCGLFKNWFSKPKATTCTTTGCADAGCAPAGGCTTTNGCATDKGCAPNGCASTGVTCTSTCVPGTAAVAHPSVRQVAKSPVHPLQTLQPKRNLQPVKQDTITPAKSEVTEQPQREYEPASFTPQAAKYGHAKDYRWLVGVLQRVHTPGSEWKIRYAGLDQQDAWGGSMVLAQDIRIDNFKDGDVVYVEGEILADRPTVYLSGPLYRVRTIRGATAQDVIRQASK